MTAATRSFLLHHAHLPNPEEMIEAAVEAFSSAETREWDGENGIQIPLGVSIL